MDYFDNLIKQILSVQKTMSDYEEIDTNIGFNDWWVEIFPQVWGNTSGGMEGIGGCALTVQNTCVVYNDEYVYVFFNGQFGYVVNMNSVVKKDITDKSMAGKSKYKDRYKKYLEDDNYEI